MVTTARWQGGSQAQGQLQGLTGNLPRQIDHQDPMVEAPLWLWRDREVPTLPQGVEACVLGAAPGLEQNTTAPDASWATTSPLGRDKTE